MNGRRNVCLHFPATGQWKLICLRAIFNHPGRAEPRSESAPLLRSFPPSVVGCPSAEPASDIAASSLHPVIFFFSCFCVLCPLLGIKAEADSLGEEVQQGFLLDGSTRQQHLADRLSGLHLEGITLPTHDLRIILQQRLIPSFNFGLQ